MTAVSARKHTARSCEGRRRQPFLYPRKHGIRAELQGAEILRDKGFVHIDRRNSGRYKHNNNVAKINLNRIIFRAKSPTQIIAFNDEDAVPGEELIINFIQLKPYLE